MSKSQQKRSPPTLEPDNSKKIKSSDEIGTGLVEFGRKLFSQLAKEEKNVVISPMSIFSALSMLSFGASGVTQDEILKTLNLSKLEDVERLLSSFQSAIDSQVLSLAHSTFVNAKNSLLPQFVADVQKYFKSEIISKDFFFAKSEESANEINKWVETQTHEKIKNLISPKNLTAQTLLVLVSAIYFKSNWEKPFDIADTKEVPFKVDAKTEKQVKMMNKTGGRVEYGENEVAKWVRLPYEPKGAEFSAVLILPQKSGNLQDVIPLLFSSDEKLDLPTDLQKFGTLAIPKFKIEFDIELAPLLRKIGINAAFGGAADLSKLADGPLHVSNVIHKAMIEVDEVGTVAAAATAISVSRSKAKYVPPNFIANEPFFFLLEHTPSSSIIFTAKVYDPSL